MDISEIKTLLADEDPQLRLRGLVSLREFESDDAVPLLVDQRQDEAFLVRSFVAMGLGRKRNETAYQALLEMLETESDHNVQSEIANSLGLYGDRSIDRLMQLFKENDNWLVRRSILAIVPDMNCPQQLYELGLIAMDDTDETIVQAGVATMGLLADTSVADSALARLVPFQTSSSWRLRMYLAYALKGFSQPQAQAMLQQLRGDENHKVVAAALEGLLPEVGE